ncbi:MAG: calcium-binding EGF-like domain-containing protein [Saprospiraceae bacterium]|nr:calcium-binding EGF-like domain-containing protein [Saprospiraceae bacterium]MCB9320433.1 calcium-binding EGF-like domain-containing protein [Lewinellaceae bacterium]
MEQRLRFSQFIPLLIFSFILLAQSCKKADPCEGVTCQNDGVCVDGSCQCPTGWEGEFCQTRTLPSAIKITSLSVTKFPETMTNGAAWDADGSGPELLPYVLTLESDNKTPKDVYWGSKINTTNSSGGRTINFPLISPALTIDPVDKYYAFFLYDYDDGSLDAMGGIIVNFAEHIDDRPETFSIDCSTCIVGFEVGLEYIY